MSNQLSIKDLASQRIKNMYDLLGDEEQEMLLDLHPVSSCLCVSNS